MKLSSSETKRRSFLGSFMHFFSFARIQLLAGLIFAVAIPFFSRIAIQPELWNDSVYLNTAVLSSIAVISGFLFFRRFDRYPEVELPAYIIISLLLSFGIIGGYLLLFRVPYNQYLLLAGFGVSTLFYIVLVPAISRSIAISYAIIPGGDANQVIEAVPYASRLLTTASESLLPNEYVVIDLHHDHPAEWERFIADCTLKRIPVFHFKQVLENVTGKVDIERLSENNFGSVLPDDFYLKVKFVFDIFLLILVLPLVALICAVVAVISLSKRDGPVIFRQLRTGYRGVPFIAYKFRTMVHNQAGDQSDPLNSAMTKTDDPRITKLGAILRRFRLDELPQILNIARGEMSWIGPRPEANVLATHYEQEIPFYRYRHAVRPGITGWAQVRQGHVTSVEDVREKLKFDFYYIKNVSLSLDIIIILLTVKTLLFGKGVK